ncbi:MAG: triose-phosphate isomerase [Candidatus Shapirobacteria bacterium]|jgi:triosephosphate isomerase
MILVNFKIYRETFGEGATRLAAACKIVAEKTGVQIIPVVSAIDAYRIIKEVGMEVMVQHTDGMVEGTKSGFVSTEQAVLAGISGSLVNHSEHKVKPGTIKKMLAVWPEKFKSVVCIQTQGQTERWAKNIKPDFIAYEPSYLIACQERSVATEKPEVIEKIVDRYRGIPVLVGAGIHSVEDVRISLSLGAKGILISSFIVKSANPEADLLKLAEVFSV